MSLVDHRENIKQLIIENPNDHSLFVRLGLQLEDLGNIPASIRAFVISLEKGEDSPVSEKTQIARKIAELCQSLSLFEKASHYYCLSLLIDRNNFPAYYGLSDCLSKLYRPVDAGLVIARHCPPDLIREFCPHAGRLERSLLDTVIDNSIRHDLVYPRQQDLSLAVKMPKTCGDEGSLPQFIEGRDNVSQHFPDAYVATLEGGRAFADPDGSVVIDKEDHVISELSTGNYLLMGHSPLPQSRYIDSTLVFLCTKWGFSFYHWITDVLIRFLMVLRTKSVDEIN